MVHVDPPQILTQLPQQLTWNEGDSKEITCNTDGKPKPRVTWKKDDIVIKQARQTAKLDFPSVTYKAVGLYKCLAENAGGRKQKQVQVNVLCKHTCIMTFRVLMYLLGHTQVIMFHPDFSWGSY